MSALKYTLEYKNKTLADGKYWIRACDDKIYLATFAMGCFVEVGDKFGIVQEVLDRAFTYHDQLEVKALINICEHIDFRLSQISDSEIDKTTKESLAIGARGVLQDSLHTLKERIKY